MSGHHANGHPVLWVISGAACLFDGLVRGHWIFAAAWLAVAALVAVTRPDT